MMRIPSQPMAVTLVAALVLWLSGCNWERETYRDNTQDNLRVVFQIPAQVTNDPITTIPDASVDGSIAVAFSRQMDVNSLHVLSFLVSSANGASVSGAIVHLPTESYPSGFILFQPTAPLAYDTLYTVTIKAGVGATDGTLLSEDHSWSFMTASPPTDNFGGGPNASAALSRAASLVASPVAETPVAAIQADGKMIAVGHVDGAKRMEFVVARYNAEGGLDVSFSSDGIASAAIGTGNSQALAATVQADGRIVAVGVGSSATDQDFALARYLTNGDFDPTFSDDGRRHLDLGTGDEHALAVAVQPDNKIMVAGSGSGGAAFILARYNVDGSADATFGTSGIVSVPATVSSEAGYAMVLQSDGKIVVASKARVGATQVTVTRYQADGSIDATFNGSVSLALPVLAQQATATLAAHADGRIALVQHGGTGATAQFTVLGYLVY